MHFFYFSSCWQIQGLAGLGESNHFRFGFDMNALGFGLKIGPVFVDANVQLRS